MRHPVQGTNTEDRSGTSTGHKELERQEQDSFAHLVSLNNCLLVFTSISERKDLKRKFRRNLRRKLRNTVITCE